MESMHIRNTRNGLVESVHRVSVAVVDRNEKLVASAGDPRLVTYMRSAAKPFQALPLVQDGAVEKFDITLQEMALACASHNSELAQVQIVQQFLERIGCSENDLACGPHRSLGLTYGIPPLPRDQVAAPSPVASNCSGKHTGMLALARTHGWETRGYNQAAHPVQQRIRNELARWTCMNEADIQHGVDGCTVTTFALPLDRMAFGIMRLITAGDEAAHVVTGAMTQHPELVAGQGRLCTELMRAYAAELIVKVGAEGVYVAGLRDRGYGIALKVEDGNGRAAMVALLAVLEALGLDPPPSQTLPQFTAIAVRNTRGRDTGSLGVAGRLAFV